MKLHFKEFYGALLLTLAVASAGFAHDVSEYETHQPYATNAVPLPLATEKSGPVRTPKAIKPGTPVSGQGFWKFIAMPSLTPVPPAALPKVVGAHGTIIVDKSTGMVYWGLQGVGWIGFSNRLQASWIVTGDRAFTNGNLHGADIWPRRKNLPLIAAADNVSGKIYLSDTSFQHAEWLSAPEGRPYADGKNFRPTDVAFANSNELWITDGYGKAWFTAADVSPLKYRGMFFGGKSFSQTPHGITLDPHDHSLLLSARPEGQIKRFDPVSEQVTQIASLPVGSTICDLDIWGDYALAPCLDGPNKTPGPIYIINLKKRTIVAAIKPKEDLGYTDAQHIHDAAWYVTGSGRDQEVYIVFTNWNPGGVGALKLVNVAE